MGRSVLRPFFISPMRRKYMPGIYLTGYGTYIHAPRNRFRRQLFFITTLMSLLARCFLLYCCRRYLYFDMICTHAMYIDFEQSAPQRRSVMFRRMEHVNDGMLDKTVVLTNGGMSLFHTRWDKKGLSGPSEKMLEVSCTQQAKPWLQKVAP